MYATAGSFRSVTRSSSPLRGAATGARRRSPRPRGRVIIAPTRGSNPIHVSMLNWRDSVIIAPTRGSNSHSADCAVMRRSGHHRPYEGQQRQPRGGRLGDPLQSSSPLRGAATCRCSRRSRWRSRSSSPLRGAATGGCARPARRAAAVIIAPTRGSNPTIAPHAGHLHAVIIAPTRGSNTRPGSASPSPASVIIAPTRGSNYRKLAVLVDHLPRHHRFYEGQQLPGGDGPGGDGVGSSSPLRGAATRPRRPVAVLRLGHHRPYEGQQRQGRAG